jgi:hypothetical protein
LCLKTALSHCDTWVRLAAVWASSCIGWCELQEVLKNISETDSSDDVQLLASQMLQVFNVEGENKLFTVLDSHKLTKK